MLWDSKYSFKFSLINSEPLSVFNDFILSQPESKQEEAAKYYFVKLVNKGFNPDYIMETELILK